MTFKFSPQPPRDFSGQPVLISGQDSTDFKRQEFLTIENKGQENVFEIRYEVHCSPFKEASLLDNILGVGHEEHFYLFDLKTNSNLITLKLEGYFGHMYVDNELFYVAGASGLYCMDKNGRILWKNINLGVDGVIVETFGDEVILGTGEWDPPNGWRDFKLKKSTGELIK